MQIIGVDTGGTFTDFIIYDNGKIESFKLLSNPRNPEQIILEGLKKYLNHRFILVHGTTVATNAFLEKKRGKTALIITKGFKDIFKIGRQNRINLFSLSPIKPEDLISDNFVFEVEERVLYNGKISIKINEKEIIDIIKLLEKRKVKTIAILFLHSYVNNINEKKVKEILEKRGKYYISVSSEILPEYREYERGIVTVLNASLMPIVSNYVKKLDKTVNNKLYIMQSNGGVLPPSIIRKEPIRTLLSGPSGGLIAAKNILEKIGEKNIITLDMGGTSTDVSIVKNGNLSLSKDRVMNNLKIKIPMLDIETVGAGGGSIAKVDSAGVLQVGPESAGAYPGPACYGKSELPTVTDAFTVLNIIDSEYFLGGKMKIYPEKSFKAIKKIGDKIGKTVYETAEGIINISISSVERALRAITVEKGDDPRYFTLVPFGGAGGLVASLLSENLDIKKIIIPYYQGVFSAFGMLFSDFMKEYTKSVLKEYSSETLIFIDKQFKEMEKEGSKTLDMEEIPKEKREFIKYLDMRYKGQSYELSIEYNDNFKEIFHQQHKKLYSYSLNDDDIEIVNMRLIAKGKISKIQLKKRRIKNKIIDRKKEIFFKGNFREFNIYKRENLSSKSIIKSPAIIISEFSTILVDEIFNIRIDEFLNIILERRE
jgi:N-methylhydantoinase A/oxoprolinase/acetone carboxylase beta subunit